MTTEESLRLGWLLEQARACAEHHYNKMLESARFFLWGWTAAMGTSFALVATHHDAALVDLAAIPILWIAWVIAGVGQRVVVQQRQLFEYEHRLRVAIERALGLECQRPGLHNMTKWALFWPVVRAGQRASDLEYEPAGGDSKKLHLSGDDILRIRNIARTERRSGMFGALLMMFKIAFAVTLVATPWYALWLLLAHPDFMRPLMGLWQAFRSLMAP
jgi:hypothetical protein